LETGGWFLSVYAGAKLRAEHAGIRNHRRGDRFRITGLDVLT